MFSFCIAARDEPLAGAVGCCQKKRSTRASPAQRFLLALTACGLLRGGRAMIRRQRDREAENVAGIVVSLDHGQPFGVRTKVFRRAVRLAWAQQIRISAGKGDPPESPPRVARPVLMPPLFQSVRPVGERSEDF